MVAAAPAAAAGAVVAVTAAGFAVADFEWVEELATVASLDKRRLSELPFGLLAAETLNKNNYFF
jgi:hypothetical protein